MADLRRKVLGVTCAAAVLAGMGAGAAGAVPADWTVMTTPTVEPEYLLNDIDTSGADRFAVGYVLRNQWAGTVALQWNGQQWERTPTPEGLTLNGLNAVSPSDVWAVGLESNTSTLIVHWDGKEWTKVASPTPDNLPSGAAPALNSVFGTANDLWAVGCAQESLQNGFGLLQHWDGTKWTAVDVPKPAGANGVCLRDVDFAVDGVKAVGYIGTDEGPRPFAMELVNGEWKVLPAPGTKAAKFTGVTEIEQGGERQLLAAGYLVGQNGQPNELRPYLMRWDGTAWIEMPHPLQDTAALLEAAAGADSGNAWVGGYTTRGAPVMMHWDGMSWTKRTAGLPASLISGLTVDEGDGSAWAVGAKGNRFQGLIARNAG